MRVHPVKVTLIIPPLRIPKIRLGGTFTGFSARVGIGNGGLAHPLLNSQNGVAPSGKMESTTASRNGHCEPGRLVLSDFRLRSIARLSNPRWLGERDLLGALVKTLNLMCFLYLIDRNREINPIVFPV